MTIRTYLGVAGLTDVGYQFFLQNTSQGARQTAGILDEGDGWYSVTGVTLLGDNVRWNSTGTPTAIAREDLFIRLSLAADVWDEPASSHLVPGSMGALENKLNISPTAAFVTVIPAAPVDMSLCRVYGYFETPDNQPAVGVPLTFTLTNEGPLRSERLIAGRIITVTTNDQGQLVNDAGQPWIDLQRNDLLTPAGTKYRITSGDLQFNQEIILSTDTLDLSTLL
jgi:hypothetical protein